jgi:hypothetical protein
MEYAYLFRDGAWFYSVNGEEFEPLTRKAYKKG